MKERTINAMISAALSIFAVAASYMPSDAFPDAFRGAAILGKAAQRPPARRVARGLTLAVNDNGTLISDHVTDPRRLCRLKSALVILPRPTATPSIFEGEFSESLPTISYQLSNYRQGTTP